MLIERPPATRRRRVPRWAWILGVSLLALLTIGIVILATKWPFSREAIAKAIQEATARPVQIGAFKRSYFPPGCLAENVRVLHNSNPEATPLVTIEKLMVQGSFTGMFSSPKRLAEVKAAGMRIVIPPKGSKHGTAKLPPLDSGKDKLEVSKIVLDDTTLEFLPSETDDEPYRLHIDALTLKGVGSGKPWSYDAILKNTRPPGVIKARGEFGPWNPDDAGATVASGEYTYRDVDLGVFRGISGILQAKGKFRGPLAGIETDGAIELEDFRVDDGNAVPMKIEYRATVNGTKGHVQLDPVEVSFWRTTLLARGSVAGTATLDLSIPRGRIDDVLRIFVKEKTSPLSGALQLDAKFLWPPGPRKFVEKIRMDIDFGITGSRFRSEKTQGTIDRISKGGDESGDTLSNLRGRAAFRGGVARFSDVTFDVPGAAAKIDGTYGLVDKQVNLRGVLHTTGSLSDAATGFKAFVLKAISPFIGKKKDNVKIVPFKITGTFKDAKVGLD